MPDIFYFLIISAILVIFVCVCIFAVRNEKKPPGEDYTAPPRFDRRMIADGYGTLTERQYDSKTIGIMRKCYVYKPPGYDPNVTYPTMYLLHGIGGIHTEWLSGNLNEILSNLINDGEAKPMIVVMPNARAMNPDDVPYDVFTEESINAFYNFINDLKNDLMPFIEKEYKVSSERTGRAIAGLSMGGMDSLYIGISMPETFGYIGAFSAAPRLPLTPAQMRLPYEYRYNTFIMICCGLQDNLLPISKNYNKYLRANGARATYYTIPGGHDFGVWKNGLYNFAKKIFI
jgi:enterochelin esterase-like enzyme